MSSSLRQRQRREVAENEAREHRQNVVVTREKKRIATVHTGASSIMGKIYAVLLVSLILLLFGLISMVRPNLLPWNRPPLPRQILAVVYPHNISPLKDLLPVVNSYSICTNENLETRNAIRYIIQQRESLKSRSLRVVLYPREYDQVESFAKTTTICGDDFREKFLESPLFIRTDLFLWCLLHASRVQGIMEYGVEFHRTLQEYQNMAIQYTVGEKQRILPSIVISTASTVPSSMLNWILSSNEWEESRYRQGMEEHLFELIQNDSSNVTWTLLDAACGQDDRSAFVTRK